MKRERREELCYIMMTQVNAVHQINGRDSQITCCSSAVDTLQCCILFRNVQITIFIPTCMPHQTPLEFCYSEKTRTKQLPYHVAKNVMTHFAILKGLRGRKTDGWTAQHISQLHSTVQQKLMTNVLYT